MKFRELWFSAVENVKKNVTFLSLWVIALSVFPGYLLSNQISFLTDDLGFSFTTAAAVVNGQDCLTGIFGIIGAILVNVYLTHHGLIFASSLIYLVGLLFVTSEFSLLKSSQNKVAARWLVGVGLALVAVVKSSLKNSAYALSENKAKTPLNIVQYTIYLIIIVVSLIRTYTSKNDEYNKEFLASAYLMLLLTALTLVYLKRESFKKPAGERRGHLKYETLGVLRNHSRLEDRAAETEEERNKRLCVEKEENMRLQCMAPMCITFLAYGMVKSIGNTFFLWQGNQMDTTIGKYNTEIPLQTFLVLAELVGLGTRILYRVLVSRKLTERRKKYAHALEYVMGTVLSSLCCIVASWIAMEVFERSTAKSKLSVFWLTPQFILFGAMDGLAAHGIEEFFCGQLPSLKRYGSLFTEGVIGVGSFFATILVLVTKASTSWLSKEKEQGGYRLDKFYHLLTVVAVAIFVCYIIFAVRYYQVNPECQQEGSDEDAIEQNLPRAPSRRRPTK